MSRVLVVDAQRRPLHPCTPARARLLLKQRKAEVFRRFPFVLILKEPKPEAVYQELRAKIDPGSKTTGLAVVNDRTGEVLWAAELVHRGQEVREALAKRRAARRSRRARQTRYRKPRFNNRRRKSGWLPPSLRSRRDTVLTWVGRLRKWCPLGVLSLELVKFDTALIQDATLRGEDYQRGTLAGFELRQYVLLKWKHTCAYCGASGVSLELDHVVPRSRHGSDRESNRVPACHSCNQQKGDRTIEEFLRDRPEVLQHIQTHLKIPLSDAAAINALRWALFEGLQATGLPVETGSGGRTKWNRVSRALPKSHWLDAAAVGASTPSVLQVRHVVPLLITAQRRQRRQMVMMDKRGFPRTRAKQRSCVQGFRTGDIVRATVPAGKKSGSYVGRVAVRASGSFNITTKTGTIQGVASGYCAPLHRADGYSYQKGERCFLPIPQTDGCPHQLVL
jgi:5-methylcytosine-specific restriction endonuclease McrA